MNEAREILRIEQHIHSLKNRLEVSRGEKADLVKKVEQLEYELEQYRGQGGTINMERSWKSKYREALKIANERLEANGLEPVRIRNRPPLPRNRSLIEDSERSAQMQMSIPSPRGLDPNTDIPADASAQMQMSIHGQAVDLGKCYLGSIMVDGIDASPITRKIAQEAERLERSKG